MKSFRFSQPKKPDLYNLISERLRMPCNRSLISKELGISLQTVEAATSPAFVNTFFSFDDSKREKFCRIVGGIFHLQVKNYYQTLSKKYKKVVHETSEIQ